MKNLFLLFVFLSLSVVAQTVNPELLTKNWRAFWVYVPNTDPNDYGVYHFRKVLSLEAKPATYVVHVSADNRYKLFVNGQLVSLGSCSWRPLPLALRNSRYCPLPTARQQCGNGYRVE